MVIQNIIDCAVDVSNSNGVNSNFFRADDYIFDQVFQTPTE